MPVKPRDLHMLPPEETPRGLAAAWPATRSRRLIVGVDSAGDVAVHAPAGVPVSGIPLGDRTMPGAAVEMAYLYASHVLDPGADGPRDHRDGPAGDRKLRHLAFAALTAAGRSVARGSISSLIDDYTSAGGTADGSQLGYFAAHGTIPA